MTREERKAKRAERRRFKEQRKQNRMDPAESAAAQLAAEEARFAEEQRALDEERTAGTPAALTVNGEKRKPIVISSDTVDEELTWQRQQTARIRAEKQEQATLAAQEARAEAERELLSEEERNAADLAALEAAATEAEELEYREERVQRIVQANKKPAKTAEQYEARVAAIASAVEEQSRREDEDDDGELKDGFEYGGWTIRDQTYTALEMALYGHSDGSLEEDEMPHSRNDIFAAPDVFAPQFEYGGMSAAEQFIREHRGEDDPYAWERPYEEEEDEDEYEPV